MNSNHQEYNDWFETAHSSTPHNEFSEICECTECSDRLEFGEYKCD